jgi:purine-cytosine permease-like protein
MGEVEQNQVHEGRLRRWLRPPEVETIGIDRIPEDERTATPWSFFFLSLGSAYSLGYVAFGWIPITLGLGFWDSITSMFVGTAVGCFILIPLILVGTRTATNNATSSGAHFGVRGRLVGSLIVLLISIAYTAEAIWVGGDAILASSGRLLGIDGLAESTAARSITFAVLIVLVAVIALYGFKLMLRYETAMAVIGAALLLLAIPALWRGMDLGYAGGEYVLAGRWQTWMLSMVIVGVSGPMAFPGLAGDWARYIPAHRYPARKMLPPSLFGVYLSLAFPMAIGTLTAVAFADPFAPYGQGLVDASPLWFVVIILVLGVLATGGSAVTTQYSAGLDFQAIFARLTRLQSTIITCAIGAAVVFLGALVWDLSEAIVVLFLVLLVLTTPWAIIVDIGYLLCRGQYDLDSLQVFNRGERGGIYWFTAGFNWRAVLGWLCGSTFGLLALYTTAFEGPLANIAGGIDVSFLGSMTIAAGVYLVLRAIFPEGDRLTLEAPIVPVRAVREGQRA